MGEPPSVPPSATIPVHIEVHAELAEQLGRYFPGEPLEALAVRALSLRTETARKSRRLLPDRWAPKLPPPGASCGVVDPHRRHR